jgi:hypothetical protein
MRKAKNDTRGMSVRAVDIVESQVDSCTESQEEEAGIVSDALPVSRTRYLRYNNQRIRRRANKDHVCRQLYQLCYDQGFGSSELTQNHVREEGGRNEPDGITDEDQGHDGVGNVVVGLHIRDQSTND